MIFIRMEGVHKYVKFTLEHTFIANKGRCVTHPTMGPHKI